MKDKPVSHKDKNTFRFLTFSERISKININNVIHKIGQKSRSSDDPEYFREAVEKWVDLNYSQDYGDLQREIGSEIRNHAQIVHRQGELIEILLKYLQKEESLALDAVLELIVALAKDLQSDFYPHFSKFFSALVAQLSTRDAELLEKVFTCLANLFKELWKCMLKDIKNVYRLFSTLLSDKYKEHIRIFAVESFAFLIRKVLKESPEIKCSLNKEELFSFILEELEKNPEQSFGVGQLFFEVVKGVKEQFHSCTEKAFKLLLQFLGDDNRQCDLIEQTLTHTVTAMAKHTTKKHCLLIQNIFCDVIKEILSCTEEEVELKSQEHLHCVLRLFLLWINFKGSRLISPDSNIVGILMDLGGKKYLPVSCLKTVVEIIATVIQFDCLSLPFDKSHAMVVQVYTLEPEIFIHFTKKILHCRMFEKDILPNLLTACVRLIEAGEKSKDIALQTLAETVVSLKPAITTGDCIKSFTKLYFNLPEKKDVLEEFLFETLSLENVSPSDLPNLWAGLVCLPHLRYLSNQKWPVILQKLANYLHHHILSLDAASSFKEVEEYNFVLNQVYFAYLITCQNPDEGCLQTPLQTANIIPLLKKYPKSVSILRLTDLHFSCTQNSAAVSLLECLSDLIPNLASPFHLIRLFTLKILNTLNSYFSDRDEECSIFTVCLEAEKISLDVQSYREKLKWLRKLEFQFLEKQLSGELEEKLVKSVVYYIIGMLFVNFKLLWDPAIDILETYAHGKNKCFWDVFGNYLYEITEMCEKNELPFKEFHDITLEHPENVAYYQCFLQFCKPDENPDVGNHRLLLWKAMEKFPDVVEPKNKTVTPLIFRLMAHEMVKVDQTMASKESLHKNNSTLCETSLEYNENSRNTKRKLKQDNGGSKKRKIMIEEPDKNGVSEDIEELGTSFISESDNDISDVELNEDQDYQNESATKMSETASFENSNISNVSETENRDEDESDDEDEDDQSDEESANIKSSSNSVKTKKSESSVKRKYSVVQTLAAYLSVFSKFKNPKAIHRSDDLLKLYNELLTYPDPLIQKLSFDCIMTYNFKFLAPYKENFYRILDNKTFKSEVVLFSLDKQNEIIREEDRTNVLAFLMRILYGKMLHKTGNNTTGKAQANTRRSLVFRFLGGCSADELKMFFDLVFMPFQELLMEDTLTVVKKIREGLDLCNIVPLRRQHSALNSLGLILQHLGNLAPELLPWLLKVLLVITATSMTLLEKRNEVLPWCISLLKSVRTLAVMKLIQFFKTFTKYQFRPDEIDAIYEAIVWPMLPRLELESVKMPSPLLRLFCTWSENQRYFVLFSKYQDGYKSCESCSNSHTILPHLIALYMKSCAKPRVIGVVSKIIFHLIGSKNAVAAKEEEEEEEKAAPLKINFSLCDPDDVDTDTISYGMRLLLPFVDGILQKLESTFSVLSKKRSKKALSQRDLTILLGISPHVKNSEQCSKLIRLLVTFLHNPKTEVDPQVFILNTIANLIKKVKAVESFMELFAPLFGKLTNQNSRSALTNIFTIMAEESKTLTEMAVVINKVNAYDSNIIGEPNYQLRLEGHKEALNIIQSMIAKEKINVHFIRIIIINSAFVIRTLDDMALRNSASNLLVEVVKVVSRLQHQNPENFHLLVFKTLLPEIQKGLKCTSEVQRHEFIYVLSAVLDCCKEQPMLKELVELRHQDKDLDFWENIKHLQVHRRARALLRFSDTLKNQRENIEKISNEYLLNYIIPIVQSFLFNGAYKKQNHVIDAAIETLGSIASVLPWNHYEILLKQYLDLISKDAEHHKTIVRIIVSLLDAFPFDLRSETQDSTGSMQDESPVSDQLTPEMSKKINISIRRNILPLLHQSLMKKSKHDDEHKLAGHYYPEDEEILRVPIALAMVKLLQKLPSGTIEKALPGLLLKMCELLKSRAESIRQTARETLIKMMQSLGPKYFCFLLKEMKAVMKRGYQVHVMIFTVNAVLMAIADQLTCGDLDDCLKDLIELCLNELFSDVAEEKEVTKITGKVKEARSTKSYSIFQILSKFISEGLLLDIINPLKELLFSKHSHKSLKKISECLRHIAVGLSENKSLSEKGLLIFIHVIANENIPGLNPKKSKTSSKELKYERPDIYLVPKEPGRSGPPAKISERTNIHILVEFGLQVLQYSLKRDKLSKESQDVLEMLDPFVILLTQCLTSNQVKIITLTLRCLLPFYKYPLPSFKEHTKKIVESLFILINKYASPGMGQGENFQMIDMSFKMLTVLVRDTSYHKFTEDQLHSLLSYVEQDIYDYTRHATAFSLLKAILSRKMESSELPDIMHKVAIMAITSEQENVRTQCRQLCMQYMLDYPLGKKLRNSIEFFIAQLEYHHEHGRISSMEILNSMMNKFPESILKQHAALFLMPLAARLVNDESPDCRKMSAQCIKKLLEKVNHDGRAVLFPVVLNLLQEKKMSIKRLMAQVCGLFAEVEQEQFEHRLIEILPIYCELIKEAANKEVEKATDERCTDHFLYHLLNSLTKMFSFTQSVLRKPQHSEIFNEFWGELQGVLLYPHMWVRLAVDQLFGFLLSSYTVEEVIEAVSKENTDVYINSRQKLRDLSADFSTQIQSQYLNEKLGEQIVRNLLYLSRVISAMNETPKGEDDVDVTLSWMVRKMCREAKKEVAETPNISMRRKYVFLFIAGITHELGREIILPHLNLILIPLCREVSDASKNTSEELKKDAQEALDIIKTVVGVDDFSRHYALVQSALLKKKIKRKREKAQEAITDPEKYSKRKIKKQQSKKESKKRKILQQKGRRKTKKAKLSDIVIAS